MNDEEATLARWTRALIERELDPQKREAFLLRHGLRADFAELPNAHSAMCAVWDELTRAHVDPLAGVHFVQSLPPSAFGIVGYLAVTSETALDGLRRVAQFYRLVKTTGSMTVTERQGVVHVVDTPAAGLPPWPRHLAEAVLYAYKAFVERCTGQPVTLQSVRMQHAAPPRPKLVEEAFGASIEFGAKSNEVLFDRADLEHRLLRSDPTLQSYLLPTAERMRDALPRADPILGALHEAVAAALPSGAVSLERAARTVGVGTRTLQRRLRERALTFQDVVDRVRRDTAARLLDNPDLSMKEIAFLLGFSDPRAFRRAQKRWMEKGTSVS